METTISTDADADVQTCLRLLLCMFYWPSTLSAMLEGLSEFLLSCCLFSWSLRFDQPGNVSAQHL